MKFSGTSLNVFWNKSQIATPVYFKSESYISIYFLNIISGEDIKEHRNNNNKTFILLNIKTHFNIKVPLLPKLVKDKG